MKESTPEYKLVQAVIASFGFSRGHGPFKVRYLCFDNNVNLRVVELALEEEQKKGHIPQSAALFAAYGYVTEGWEHVVQKAINAVRELMFSSTAKIGSVILLVTDWKGDALDRLRDCKVKDSEEIGIGWRYETRSGRIETFFI